MSHVNSVNRRHHYEMMRNVYIQVVNSFSHCLFVIAHISCWCVTILIGDGVYILEPHIALTHTDLLMRGDLVKVDCTVHEPAGEPFFLLQYQRTGSKNMSISNEWASVRNLWTYHRWIYTTVLQVPDEGVIICHVTDMFGRNTVQKSIHIASRLFIS